MFYAVVFMLIHLKIINGDRQLGQILIMHNSFGYPSLGSHAFWPKLKVMTCEMNAWCMVDLDTSFRLLLFILNIAVILNILK